MIKPVQYSVYILRDFCKSSVQGALHHSVFRDIEERLKCSVAKKYCKYTRLPTYNAMHSFVEALVPAVCGFVYGITSVLVGQPLETIKTQMQTLNQRSAFETAHSILKQDGIQGLYRGGIPLVLGGGLIRSAQFGVYDNVIELLHSNQTLKRISDEKRVVDPSVLIAGVLGGVSRGLVEGPFEYIKVRQQVAMQWKVAEMFQGYGATMFRNAFLFGAFVLCE